MSRPHLGRRVRPAVVAAATAVLALTAGVAMWATERATAATAAAPREVGLQATGNTALTVEWADPGYGSRVQTVTSGTWSTVLHAVPAGTTVRVVVRYRYEPASADPVLEHGTCSITVDGRPIRSAEYRLPAGTSPAQATCLAVA